jgi:hypothetical protein
LSRDVKGACEVLIFLQESTGPTPPAAGCPSPHPLFRRVGVVDGGTRFFFFFFLSCHGAGPGGENPGPITVRGRDAPLRARCLWGGSRHPPQFVFYFTDVWPLALRASTTPCWLMNFGFLPKKPPDARSVLKTKHVGSFFAGKKLTENKVPRNHFVAAEGGKDSTT